jgi:hypothetical protein
MLRHTRKLRKHGGMDVIFQLIGFTISLRVGI